MHLRNSLLAVATMLSFSASADFKVLPDKSPEPTDNPSTPAKLVLGKMLFFEPRLSMEGTVSCNSCHNVMSQGGDGAPVEGGFHAQRSGRASSTIWNSAFQTVQFWDGRAASLEEQAMIGAEKGIERLQKIPGYISAFKSAFPKDTNPVTIDNMARAIAVYERTLITPNAPFDKYVKGNKKAMTPQQIRGMKLVDEIGCTSCHTGVNFSGEEIMGVGNYKPFPQIPGSKYDKMYDLTTDPGRFEVTKKAEDKNLWRVPTWRNVAMTAPYFHNGAVKTLDEAVRVMAKTQLDSDLTDKQVEDIVAFLNALTGKFPKQTMPKLPKL